MDRTTGISYLSVESMAKKKQQRSAVLQLLDLVYAVSNKGTSHSYELTRDDIIADRSERKERNKILALLKDVGDKEGTTAEIVKALGVKTTQD